MVTSEYCDCKYLVVAKWSAIQKIIRIAIVRKNYIQTFMVRYMDVCMHVMEKMVFRVGIESHNPKNCCIHSNIVI